MIGYGCLELQTHHRSADDEGEASGVSATEESHIMLSGNFRYRHSSSPASSNKPVPAHQVRACAGHACSPLEQCWRVCLWGGQGCHHHQELAHTLAGHYFASSAFFSHLLTSLE